MITFTEKSWSIDFPKNLSDRAEKISIQREIEAYVERNSSCQTIFKSKL